jgi:hypothetical protein
MDCRDQVMMMQNEAVIEFILRPKNEDFVVATRIETNLDVRKFPNS